MNFVRISDEYEIGIEEFIQFAQHNAINSELLNLPRVSVTKEYVESTMDEAVHDDVNDDQLKDMIRDVGVESFAKAHGYGSMPSDAKTPLYPKSTNYTQLSAVLRLMNSKAING